MTMLPATWANVTLADVAAWGSGGTPRAGDSRYYGGDIPWAVIGDLTDGLVTSTKNRITREGLESSAAKVIPAGSVLVAMYGSIGKLGINAIPLASNQAIAFARPYKNVLESKYLFYYLLSQRSKLAEAGKGATQRNISQTIIRAWPIPLPPVAEQRRIVALLEDHLSRIERGTSEVIKLAERVDGLRGALLGAACVESHPGVPGLSSVVGGSGWVETSLGEVLLRIEAGKSFRCEARPARLDEWGIIKVSAMTYGVFREEENKAVVPGAPFDAGDEIKPGDLLLSRANTESYVGASVLVGQCRPRLLLSDKSLRLVPSPSVNRRWLAHLLSSPVMRKEISRRATGTKDSMRNISQASLRKMKIRVPSISEQCKIVDIIEDRLASFDRAKKISDMALEKAGSLRSSLLKVAFEGRLVEQDRTDESAWVMLERTREARGSVGRTRRGKADKTPRKEA